MFDVQKGKVTLVHVDRVWVAPGDRPVHQPDWTTESEVLPWVVKPHQSIYGAPGGWFSFLLGSR